MKNPEHKEQTCDRGYYPSEEFFQKTGEWLCRWQVDQMYLPHEVPLPAKEFSVIAKKNLWQKLLVLKAKNGEDAYEVGSCTIHR